MFFEFLYPLAEDWKLFNLFRYVSFRSVYAVITAFVLSIALGPLVIRFLMRLKVGQTIRQDGPESHLKKTGTPTMGGILILMSLAVTTVLWGRLDNAYVWLALGSMFWFGFVGFIDDFNKLVFKNSRGISARTKLMLQFAGAAVLMSVYFWISGSDVNSFTILNIPFIKLPYNVDNRIYYIFGVLVIMGASNGVNFTDGLDGLAIGTAAFVAVTFAAIAYLMGNVNFSEYLLIRYIPEAAELTVFMAALLGTCLGFLWFNAHPAQVFMGDTGSLALGGLFGMVAVMIKQELLLVIVGGIFVVEVLSVILQVASFKVWGKRIFKMAPIHHHFELKGLAEPKVIVRFWIVAAILMLLALSTFKLR